MPPLHLVFKNQLTPAVELLPLILRKPRLPSPGGLHSLSPQATTYKPSDWSPFLRRASDWSIGASTFGKCCRKDRFARRRIRCLYDAGRWSPIALSGRRCKGLFNAIYVSLVNLPHLPSPIGSLSRVEYHAFTTSCLSFTAANPVIRILYMHVNLSTLVCSTPERPISSGASRYYLS